MTNVTLARGNVVLISFPFTDLSGAKIRPAVIVGRVLNEDVILAFVTSQVDFRNPDTDVFIQGGEADPRGTGLKKASVIRLDRLITLHRDLVRRRIGILDKGTTELVSSALRYVFEL